MRVLLAAEPAQYITISTLANNHGLDILAMWQYISHGDGEMEIWRPLHDKSRQ